jgi:TDG/mug DNA glycosylase family protein
MKCVGFGAVADPDACVLILGTLPGAESLERCEYYARKTNSFWSIMGELVGALPDMEYKERLDVLNRNGIALWDVCHSAERSGSLDSRIIVSTIEPNDLSSFLANHSRVRLICFNGRLAEKIFRRLSWSANVSQIRCEVLPSTSPAHTIARSQKLSLWGKSLGEFIDLKTSR